jgi:FixJ family two-component response regulator
MAGKAMIAIIDDDPSVRRSLERLIGRAGYKVCTFESAQEFLESGDFERADCALSDLLMPGIDGLQMQQDLRMRRAPLSLVFLTGHGDVPSSVTAMKEGAVDFLEKPIKRAVLLEAVRRAVDRTRDLKRGAIETVELKIRYASLTPREREVFELVAAGLLNKQIGAQIGAAEKTIKQHRGIVMDKMKAGSFADLVVMAERLGVRPSGNGFPGTKGSLRTKARATQD